MSNRGDDMRDNQCNVLTIDVIFWYMTGRDGDKWRDLM